MNLFNRKFLETDHMHVRVMFLFLYVKSFGNIDCNINNNYSEATDSFACPFHILFVWILESWIVVPGSAGNPPTAGRCRIYKCFVQLFFIRPDTKCSLQAYKLNKYDLDLEEF